MAGLCAFLPMALLSTKVSKLNAQQHQWISSDLLAHFDINDNRVCRGIKFNPSSLSLLQQAYELENHTPLHSAVLRVKNWHIAAGENLTLENDLQIFSEGNVQIDGNILGKPAVNQNSNGQNLIICSNGTIEINGSILLSDGGDAVLPLEHNLAKAAFAQRPWTQISASALNLLPSVQLSQYVHGGRGGSLLLKARRIVINGQVKVGSGGRGIAGGNGGAGASMIFLFEQFQTSAPSRHFQAGHGGDGGAGEAWFSMDGGIGGMGGEALLFACSNGTNGNNGTGSPTTVGTNGGNGGTGGNDTTTGIACNGGNGGNGGSGGSNNNLMSISYGNGRRGGHGGLGGEGGVAFNTTPGGSSFGGDGGNGGNGGSGGNAFGSDNDGGNGGQGGDGGTGGLAIGADGSTGGSCATTTGGDATGGDGGDGGMGGFGGFGTGTGTGGNGGRGGARGAGGNASGGSAGSCTAVTCSTPQGGSGTGGTRGARGTGGMGAPSGVGGMTGQNGGLGPQSPNGTGTDGNDGVCILPIELIQFAANLKESGVLVTWTTATELNNDYMALERSANGQDFLEIARIKGKGTTDETQHYQYFDSNPLAGINYYRLRQVDFDGTRDHSKVVAITLDKGELMSIFPNPAKDRINIQTSLTLLAKEVYLLDALGRRVAVNLQGSPGWYEIKLPAELPTGNYWLRLQDRAQTHRLVVVKE